MLIIIQLKNKDSGFLGKQLLLELVSRNEIISPHHSAGLLAAQTSEQVLITWKIRLTQPGSGCWVERGKNKIK